VKRNLSSESRFLEVTSAVFIADSNHVAGLVSSPRGLWQFEGLNRFLMTVRAFF